MVPDSDQEEDPGEPVDMDHRRQYEEQSDIQENQDKKNKARTRFRGAIQSHVESIKHHKEKDEAVRRAQLRNLEQQKQTRLSKKRRDSSASPSGRLSLENPETAQSMQEVIRGIESKTVEIDEMLGKIKSELCSQSDYKWC